MTKSNEELATKIVYLKENHYMPNIDNESVEVQNAIQSFYFCSKSVTSEDNKPNDSDFWFRLAFNDYKLTDEFVRDVNKAYKLYRIKNIGKDEF